MLTNAVRRGLTGSLGQRGWGGIAGIRFDRSAPTYVHADGFEQESCTANKQATPVLRRLGRGGRSMLRLSAQRRNGPHFPSLASRWASSFVAASNG